MHLIGHFALVLSVGFLIAANSHSVGRAVGA